MIEVNRSYLRQSLTHSLSTERAHEIMNILEPLYVRCALGIYPFGEPIEFDQDVMRHIAALTNRSCEMVEPMAPETIPHSMTTAVRSTNFLPKLKTHAGHKIAALSQHARAHNLEIDLRYSFGNRLLNQLPSNLWLHLWDPIRYWLLAEIGGDVLQNEAKALEHVVRLSANGLIVFDFKPTSPTTVLVVCNQPQTKQRYRLR